MARCRTIQHLFGIPVLIHIGIALVAWGRKPDGKALYDSWIRYGTDSKNR